ncbi:MAG TPA: FAD/NAD(P)-binding protein [Rhabdochlamydiaceae bacterium]|nr:FAD/NAD(P)-binding protein [Rhabdochlamydiaceae bacterium]
MKKTFLILFFWCISLHGIETDFDYIVVGSSPFSLFEAIYRSCLGHRVLVVEQSAECGGAWKSLTICGVPHVDLGCHEFGKDIRLRDFFEEYVGCTMIDTLPEMAKPVQSGEFYPSEGCYELTRNLQLLMEHYGVVLLLSSKLETAFVDLNREIVEVKINGMRFTTPKLIVTNNSEIIFENPELQNTPPRNPHFSFHVGMLIEDPTPPRFTYRNFHTNGASRSTNYTCYSKELQGTGKHLITIQARGENAMDNVPQFLEALKKQKLIDENAKLLQTENYIYKQVAFNQTGLHKLGPKAKEMFEIINTSHIGNLALSIDKWKKVMKPWKDIMIPELSRAG